MGRDKMYLRYEEAVSCGVIVSGDSNIAYDSSGKFLLAPALEKVGVWNVRQGVCAKTFAPTSDSSSGGPALAVTSIASSPSNFIAVGYADGSIRIWDCEKGTCETTLNGHKGAVTVLRYNKLGSLLASGSKDNDIILWDVVGETGLYRLRGHSHQVTDLVFVDSGKKLVSSSKDKFLRVWDLDTQFCMQIVSGHHTEIWSIDVDPEERYLVTGSTDPQLRLYSISNGSSISRESLMDIDSNETNDKEVAKNKWEVLNYFGEIRRQNKNRVVTVRFNHSGSLLACQVAGKMVEIFRVLDEAESNRKAKKRIHRKVKKASKVASDIAVSGNEFVVAEDTITIPDVFQLLQTLRTRTKISSISFSTQTSKSSIATLALALTNNLLETYSIESSESVKSCAIELQGHRAEIRSVALSSDSCLLMSTSHNAIKIWNPSTGSCLRTIDSGYGLCSMFVPGNKYAVVGTKDGKLEVVDVHSGTCVDVVEAHGASVESIAPIPDGSGFVTGSLDHDVKFWAYKTAQKPGQDTKHLTVSPVRNMKMDSDVHVVAVCPLQNHMAVALMDNSMRVFYMDTLKLRLTLYGHKFPVLCMDISSDGDLLVSGSADKDLKIWGLDYGNCHVSIFAHTDSVTAVKFVPHTHYIFSAGKDRLVKYWDADNRQLLLTLDGHHAEVWCLAISNRGDYLVTGSHDRSIRRWDRTEEQFHIEEEKERRLEEIFESDVDNAFKDKFDPKEELPEQGATALAGKKTRETLTATDSILDALDVADEEQKRLTEHEEAKLKGKTSHFTPNMIMLGRSPSEYVLNAVANVRTNDLEQTLLALPFTDALNLLSYLKGWAHVPDKIELVCRVATVLLQIHHFQLVSTVSARPVVTHLKDILHARVKECKDTLGFNLAAMDHLKQLMSQKSDALFSDAKAKLLEIRAQHSQKIEARSEIKTDKRKKKKQKKSDDGHVWS